MLHPDATGWPARPLAPAPASRLAPSARQGLVPGHGAVAASGEGPSPFGKLLRGMARDIEKGEAVTRAALGAAGGGRELSSAELIVLQAAVYRQSEALDLASRLLDRATGAVKAVLQSP